jgi:hypothetical protein
MHDGGEDVDAGAESHAASDGFRILGARLRGVEEQPLTARAAGFGALHEVLLRELESGDAPRDA